MAYILASHTRIRMNTLIHTKTADCLMNKNASRVFEYCNTFVCLYGICWGFCWWVTPFYKTFFVLNRPSATRIQPSLIHFRKNHFFCNIFFLSCCDEWFFYLSNFDAKTMYNNYTKMHLKDFFNGLSMINTNVSPAIIIFESGMILNCVFWWFYFLFLQRLSTSDHHQLS